MTVDELLKLIPSNTFDDLAVETKVDFQVKKLTGETIFMLILFSMLNSDRLSLDGIKVMIHMTMILAILILAYKKLNKIRGYKIAKLKFEIDLDNSIIKEIVLLCGGNPDLAKHLWNTT